MYYSIHFYAEYKGKTYHFNGCSEPFIFQTGIYKGIDTKYSEEELRRYISFTHSCYLKDTNETPLGALCEYIADHWKNVKNKGYYTVLEKFYEQLN